MKKTVLLLTCAVVLCAVFAAACGSKPAEEPQSSAPGSGSETDSGVISGSGALVPMGGGWEVNADVTPILSEEDQQTFDKAKEGFAGNDLTPVAVLATQVVAGTNLAYLCTEKLVVPGAETGWCIAVVYRDLEDNAEITSVQEIDVANIKTAGETVPEGLLGGWTVSEASGKPVMLPGEGAEAAFEKALETDGKKQLSPIALLGTQVVAGTNYKVLCFGEGGIYVAVVYSDLEGNAEFTSVEAFDLLSYIDN